MVSKVMTFFVITPTSGEVWAVLCGVEYHNNNIWDYSSTMLSILNTFSPWHPSFSRFVVNFNMDIEEVCEWQVGGESKAINLR